MPNEEPYRFVFRCSQEEAAQMRQAAKRERRSLNSFILQAAMARIELNRRIDNRLGRMDTARRMMGSRPEVPPQK